MGTSSQWEERRCVFPEVFLEALSPQMFQLWPSAVLNALQQARRSARGIAESLRWMGPPDERTDGGDRRCHCVSAPDSR